MLRKLPQYKLFALVVVLPMGRSGLPAQEGPCSTRTVMARVVRQGGTMVRGVRAEDFRATFRGAPVQILSAVEDRAPRHVVLLLDAGYYVRLYKEVWATEKYMAEDFAELAVPPNLVGLSVFADTVIDRAGFQTEPAALDKALAALESAGRAIAGGALPKPHFTTRLWRLSRPFPACSKVMSSTS